MHSFAAAADMRGRGNELIAAEARRKSKAAKAAEIFDGERYADDARP